MAKKKSKNSYSKKIYKEGKKYAKKNPKGFLALIITLIFIAALAIGGFIVYKKLNPDHSFKLNGAAVMSLKVNGDPYIEQGAIATYGNNDISKEIVITYHKKTKDGEIVDKIEVNELEKYYVSYSVQHEKMNESIYREVNIVETASISINFLELGNWNTGDSTYIKAGETDILIDGGSKRNSASTIVDYLKGAGRVEDNTIEYLIVTHAHEDHIASLVGSMKNNDGVLDKFTVKNIIQFSLTNSDTEIYKDYCTKRDNQVSKGCKLYYANDLVRQNKNVIEVAPAITMTVLDQKFYRETSGDENNYSVCTLFSHLDNNYLFTGDLEKNGEESLTQLNPNLPHCQLFKGGHHGSATANNDVLLSKITPEVVCICCCVGNDEYTKNPQNFFPAQETINRLAKYTDKIYCTTLSLDNEKKTYTSLNGNIIFSCLDGKNYQVHGSNNDTILKNTDWFKKNRNWPQV